MKENHSILYKKFLSNTCSKEDLSDLFQLFGTADENLLRDLIMEELLSAEAELPASAKEADRLYAVHQRVKTEINWRRNRIKRLIYKFGAAAAIILAITSGILLWKNPVKNPAAEKAQTAANIKPGEFQATLTLANGKKITLKRSMAATTARIGQTTVNVSPSDGVSYQNNGTGRELKNSANTLVTSRGEQSPYPLVLADGSKVWLNAASSITFPTQFSGKSRTVSVTGEAYFEVSHNKSAPFKVLSGRQEITVLGTHFNIKAYDDEHKISTTLLEGSVKVNDIPSGASELLIPGQQAILERSSGNMVIGKADLEEVVAWKNGFFMFNDQKITNIMRAVSRWYDVDVEYRNFHNNEEKFGGTFSRSSNLPDILGSLQSLGHVQFRIDKRKIIVSN